MNFSITETHRHLCKVLIVALRVDRAGFRTCLRAPGWSMVEATGRVCVNDDGPAIE
jgi:hypothetical protein